MADVHVFRPESLARAIEAIVAAGGSDAREARLVADNLVAANLAGHDSHGVGMVPRYVDALLEGGLRANQHAEVKLDSGPLLSIEGHCGYGQVVGVEAVERAIERVGRNGACIMALANAHHLGRIGGFAEMALERGLVSLHFVNVRSFARVAPYGGADGRFGTNPVCIGVPIEGEPPFVLDMATSAVAQGKLRVAHNKGEKVPFGRLIDDRGNPTDDPRWAVVPPFGAMLCFGEHKGYGLAVAAELLGGALTGGGTWRYPSSPHSDVLNGMLSIMVDPRRLGSAQEFAHEARAYVEWLRASPPAPGFDRVRIAGDPEREARAKREKEGVPVDDASWREILQAGTKLGVDPERIDQIARVV